MYRRPPTVRRSRIGPEWAHGRTLLDDPRHAGRTRLGGLQRYRRYRRRVRAAARLAAAAGLQLAEYFSGTRRSFELPLDWTAASRLQLHVLGVLFDSVGFGETVSYGALARRAAAGPDGLTVPARAIGQLMGSNPLPIIVPCHRVVAADGLGGYSGGTGIEIKRWLLTFEGALPPTLDWAVAGPARLAGPAGHRDRD